MKFRLEGEAPTMADGVEESAELLDRMKHGDERALASLFARHRARLLRLVEFRMDARLRGRIDAEDVAQEAYLDAVKRLRHFSDDTPTSFFIWLRMIVHQTLIDLHRKHLGAQARDVGREVAAQAQRHSQTTATSLAARLLGNLTSPTAAARRAELAERLEAAIEGMDPIDREVLALRHFEELTNGEVAEVLGIGQKAASLRYVRALRRLKEILTQIPGFHADYQEGV